jgi:DNA repair exonuclease SbcCD ATPase subunit
VFVIDTRIVDYAAQSLLLYIRYKKWAVFLFLAVKSYNLTVLSVLQQQPLMLSAAQIQQLMTENESLQVQLEELNYILLQREQEIAGLKENNATDAELRSMLDMQLEELQLMQNRIGKHQQKAEGAEEREFELHQELSQSVKIQQQYSDLFQQYTYINTQLEDIQAELAKVKKRNTMLQQIAVKIGEMESTVENITMERDELKARLAELEKLQNS